MPRRSRPGRRHSPLHPLTSTSTSTSTIPTPAPATRQYATAAAINAAGFTAPADYVPPTKPPTARPPETRKAQLLRTYTSLLRSTPLILAFQHNNLTAVEWAAVRRELRLALNAISAEGTDATVIASNAKLQVIRTRIFDVALKVVEFHDPSKVGPTTVSSFSGQKVQMVYNHDLSEAAYEAVQAVQKSETPLPASSAYAQLAPLLVGPVALFTLPAVSPAHLAAALSILSPSPPAFPAPSRKKNPGYYDPIAQSGLQKLMLVGGRIEDRVFDLDGVKWVGGIEGGIDSLRAQVIHMLQSAGLGLTSALEGAGKAIWLTLESRRSHHHHDARPSNAPPRNPKMDFAPYQSSPPEHTRSPLSSAAASPRTSLDNTNHSPNGHGRRGSYSPASGNLYQHRQSQFSPPPLQHPQPQRAWSGEGVGRHDRGGGQSRGGSGGGGGMGEYFSALGAREGMVSEFETSLGLRLDYEACLAYLAVPPLGAILLLILERKSDYVRFHAWQSSLLFTALFVVHLLFAWSTFLSWVFFLGDLALMAWLVLNAYRDADTLDRYEVPVVGRIASRILDDE
ncbi:upf0132 domain protein [Staphylotrichum tortipilum]|uniref:Upf0132 domain protein n=1 Tax=Staphylotrichum tortipilum TaxID=2831512 RepID=A0AAN6RXE5_9PEZI|nr:upf0132 domain protein [Staphylotrichum longicolle]